MAIGIEAKAIKVFMVKVLFFARLREQLGISEQSVEWHRGDTVQVLLNRLVTKGDDKWQVLLAKEVVAAKNQQTVSRDALVSDGDELAFFPPVTGG